MADELDAILARREKPRAKTATADDLDAILAKYDSGATPKPAYSVDPEDLITPQDLGGHIDLQGGKGEWVPNKRTRAVFTDLPNQEPMTGKQLGAVKEDTLAKGRAALAGGALQGVTFGFGDEAAAAVGALSGQGSYRELRDENRKADKDAQFGDPSAYGKGKLAGAAATIATPGLGMAAGKSLLSLGNQARAAAYGGITALGESEADLTKGEVAGAALDTAKGVGAGVAANTGLGLLGKGVKSAAGWVHAAPERAAAKADDTLIDAITLGAPATARDDLMGYLGRDRAEVLALVRKDPRLEKTLLAGDRATAAMMVKDSKGVVEAARNAELATLDAKRGYKVAPVLDSLQKRRDALMANPATESQVEAAKLNKLIETVTERFVPAPKPPVLKGEALASKLVASADSGTRERAAMNATEFGKIAEKVGLSKVADNLTARQQKIGEVLEDLNKKTAAIYDGVSDVSKQIPTAIKASGSAKSQPGFVYYSADQKKANDIASNGLMASRQGDASAVYVTPVASSAHKFATEAWQLSENPALFRVRATPSLGLKQQGDHWFTSGDVPSKSVEILTNKGWMPVQKFATRPNNDVPVANITGKLAEWSDELRKATGGMRAADAANVDKVRMQVSDWAKAAGNEATGSKTTLTPKELRALITNVQGKAFTGSYLDPNEARSMQRELAGKLRALLDEHVSTHGSPADVKKLADLNKKISALITFQESAERESVKSFEGLHKAAPTVAETRTGKASASEIYDLAKKTEHEGAKVDITGGLYGQIGKTPPKTLAGLDKQEELLTRLERPLAHKAAREASPPTTLRAGTRTILSHMRDFGAAGAVGAGTVLAATSGPAVGASVIAAGIAAKYGPAVAKNAEKVAVTMEYALRKGASEKHLRKIAELAKMEKSVADDMISALLPREAGSQAVKSNKKGEDQ